MNKLHKLLIIALLLIMGGNTLKAENLTATRNSDTELVTKNQDLHSHDNLITNDNHVASMLSASAAATDITVTIDKGAEVTLKDTDADGFYEIGNANDLYAFAAAVDGGKYEINGELTANIVVNENVLTEDGKFNGDGSAFRVWVPIGWYDEEDTSSGTSYNYSGTFDGAGYTIKGLYCDEYNISMSFVGLFRTLEEGSAVRNLGIVDSYIRGDLYSGAIAGTCDGGDIENCYNTGIVIGKNWTGGLIGAFYRYNNNSIKNCYNTGYVSGSRAGGIAGTCTATMQNCYNTGTVFSSDYAGGIAGRYYYGSDTFMEYCYNTGKVSSAKYAGALAGFVEKPTIRYCFNIGIIDNDNHARSGGLIGHFTEKPTMTNCYFLTGTVVKDFGIDSAVEVTAEQLASGEIAFLMGTGWGQNIDGEGTKDLYPVFLTENNKVYKSYYCDSTPFYTNNASIANKTATHSEDETSDGRCTMCDLYKAAPLVTEENCQSLGLTADYVGFYALSTEGHLYWLAQEVDKGNSAINAVMTADIVVNKNVLNEDGTLNGDGSDFKAWTPIGENIYDREELRYRGTFDGANHTVSGLYFNDATKGSIGLFSFVDTDASVKNVGVLDSYLYGKLNVGGVAGVSYGPLENCYNASTVMADATGVGGVAGWSDGITRNCYNIGCVSGYIYVGGVAGCASGTVQNCYNMGTVKSINRSSEIGGVAGRVGTASASVVENCYNSGKIIAGINSEDVGGVAGKVYGTVRNCYNTGEISTESTYYVGGVIGENRGTVQNCYSVGKFTVKNSILGGILGQSYSGSITNCYYDSDVAGGKAVGQKDGGTVEKAEAKTTAQFTSGEVAYLLGDAFGQDIDNGKEVQTIPSFTGAKIYFGYTDCGDADGTYSNSSELLTERPAHTGSVTYNDVGDGTHGATYDCCGFTEIEQHTFTETSNGFCTACGGYQSAELNEDGYYEIANAGQLFWFAKYINTVDRTASAVLTADIDLENRPWTPIGSTGQDSHNFRGVFDGQNHTIKGLYVEGGRAGLGFFGEVRTGTVKNFTIYGEVVVNTDVNYVGGVIGSACGLNGSDHGLEHNGATIQNITSYVNLTAKTHGIGMVGGFIGYANHQSVIENCSWYGTFDAGEYRVDSGAGGFIGRLYDTSDVTVRNCAAYGTIKTAYKSGTFENYSTIYIGGFLSYSPAGAQTVLENNLWAGEIINNTDLEASNAHLSAFGTMTSFQSITNCYALNSTPYVTTNNENDNGITTVTEAKLASGEVAYLLQGEQENHIWGQNIDNGEMADAYPVLGGAKVYKHTFDFGNINVYSNLEILDMTPHGKCGDYLYWNITENTLTIFGTGAMYDYKLEASPWYTHKESLKTLVLEEGMTYIGEYAFYNCSDFTGDLIIPNSVTSIGICAFYECSGFTGSLIIPNSVTTIDNYAFDGCYGFTEVFFYRNECPYIDFFSFYFFKAKIHAPVIWESFTGIPEDNLVKMPTFVGQQTTDNGQQTSSTGWVFPEGQTEISAEDHVAINAPLLLSQRDNETTSQQVNSLRVKSFGYCGDGTTTNGSITIEEGGQLYCETARGEVTVRKEIIGYAGQQTTDNGQQTSWYTIASPLKEAIDLSNSNTFITSTPFDLYRYDEPTHTWQNAKPGEGSTNFQTIESGRGYLYANAENTTLEFKGNINTEDVNYTLTAQGEVLNGFHLVGNPYTHDISFNHLSTDAELANGYYVLNGEGAWGATLGNEGDVIKVGQGALIKTTSAGALRISKSTSQQDNESTSRDASNMYRSRRVAESPSRQVLKLSVANSNYSDKAFVVFDKGVGLDKINHENENIPLLYIPQDGTDYAIAMMDENVSEIPVSFEAMTMGQYTISLQQENCGFEELYLLDKETGEKVNILEEDYTFMATTADNAERFVLLKDNGQQTTDNSHFAYVSGEDLIISVEGAVQIIDVMGRIIYTNDVTSDNNRIDVSGFDNAAYVVRVVNENGVKVQKIIL